MRSAVILVGGKAQRANGREKYFFQYQGKTFIERLIETLKDMVDEVVIVASDLEQCHRFDHIGGIRCTMDIRQGIGPIGGFHAGVLEAKGELIIVCACDMPCIKAPVIHYLFNVIGDHDAAIPKWNNGMHEPFLAVYRRNVLMKYFLRSLDSHSPHQMIRSINTLFVPVNDLRPIDSDLQSFTNINTLEDLERINR